jgi:tight adherence protein B
VTGGFAAIVLALAAAYGVFLLYTAWAFGWRGIGVSATPGGPRRRRADLDEWLVQAGLEKVRPVEFLAVTGVLFVVGLVGGLALFAGPVAAVVIGLIAAAGPILTARARRLQRRERTRDAWPRMLEELRLQAISLGRSIPQALFSVGMRGPEELRPAFAAAQREWLISTDFDRTLEVLKAQLADPTADAVAETLLIAHEIGGTDVDRRLKALIEDRIQDLQGRKDARAKQAGARFARWFVLVVPLGMALVGLSIGEGRAAYASAGGQLAVLVALGLIALCWLWAGRLMQLPQEQRVFTERSGP